MTTIYDDIVEYLCNITVMVNSMKHSLFILCLASLILLFTVVVLPVAADPSISSISPTSGSRGDTVTITITGSGFDLPTSSTTKYVRLYNSDTTNITASSISSKSSTKIVAKFSIGSSKTKGDWYVVVVNDDGTESMSSDEFVISDDMTLSSISPSTAKTNDDDVSFTLSGSGLSDVEEVYLYKSTYSNVSASDLDAGSSSVTGTFDLTDVSEATYKVCAMDTYGAIKCSSSVTFGVTTDEVGEIDVSSSPSNANVYLDSVYVGTTPYALTEVTPGSHVIKVSKDGYSDWSKIVKVTADDTTTVTADLSAISTTVATTVPTQVITSVKTALPVTTVKITSIKATTTAAATTTKASPVEMGVILGAIGLGMVVLHRKH